MNDSPTIFQVFVLNTRNFSEVPWEISINADKTMYVTLLWTRKQLADHYIHGIYITSFTFND